MAREEFNIESLGIPANILPAELGGNFLENLDRMFARQEERQANTLLDQQEEKGLFRSGQTRDRLQEEVLAPSVDRRRQSLLELSMGAMGQAREERLGEQDFQRKRQFAEEDFKRRLEEIGHSVAHQKELLKLQRDLGLGGRGGGGGGMAGFAGNFGQAAFTAMGQAFGGPIGGAMASGSSSILKNAFMKSSDPEYDPAEWGPTAEG